MGGGKRSGVIPPGLTALPRVLSDLPLMPGSGTEVGGDQARREGGRQDRPRLWGGLTATCTHQRCPLNQVKASRKSNTLFPHPVSVPVLRGPWWRVSGAQVPKARGPGLLSCTNHESSGPPQPGHLGCPDSTTFPCAVGSGRPALHTSPSR